MRKGGWGAWVAVPDILLSLSSLYSLLSLLWLFYSSLCFILSSLQLSTFLPLLLVFFSFKVSIAALLAFPII